MTVAAPVLSPAQTVPRAAGVGDMPPGGAAQAPRQADRTRTAAEMVSGHTWHGRKGEVKNTFRYGVDYILIDPDAPAPRGLRLFRRNARGLTSIHDRDHGGAPGQGAGAAWVRDALWQAGLPGAARVLLLTQPRVLGHVFNPVSFWLCHDGQDRLRVVVAEVTNTYGDRHSYLCHRDDMAPITADDTLRARKMMHVSPFQPVEGGYAFRFDITPAHVGIRIDFTGGSGGVVATLTGARRPLTDAALLRACLRRPFGSRRVLALIHWQALRLWWKGARFRPRPAAPERDISR